VTLLNHLGDTAGLTLLAHDRDATIILAHVGRDTTGDMTAAPIG